MTDPSIADEVAGFMGLAGRIVAARLDEDHDQVAAIVNADRNAAIDALIEALTSLGVHMYGTPEQAAAMFRAFALRAELHSLDVPGEGPPSPEREVPPGRALPGAEGQNFPDHPSEGAAP